MGKASEEKFDFEKYKKTEEGKKAQDNFNRRLCFNKKYRDDLKKLYLGIQKRALENLSILSRSNDIQARKELVYWEALLDTSISYFKVYDKVEEYILSRKILRRRFEAYKSSKEASVIFKFMFYKVIEKRNRIGYLVLPHGITKRKYSGKIVRKKVSLTGYKLFDKGKFDQILQDFHKAKYIFKGKKVYKIKVTQRGKVQDNLWAEQIT